MYDYVSHSTMSRTETFIALVNARLCAGNQEQVLQELWKEASFYPTCTVLVSKGDRMGQSCGKAAVKGTELCMCHTPREKKEKPVVEKHHCSECPRVVRKGQSTCTDHRVIITCPFVLVKGVKKGEVCGKKGTCKRHQRVPEVQEVRVIQEDIPEVQESKAGNVIEIPRLSGSVQKNGIFASLSIQIPIESEMKQVYQPYSPDYPPPDDM